ncbi:MAG: NAD-binding protein, partial [Myxococcales bacterium]|nr:NAD-binding protein [Myxococcales bacterium]
TASIVTKAGVSLGLGAFLAGLVVAGSEYRHQALSDLMPFREVLTSLFFVSIGMLLDISLLISDASGVLTLLAAILIGKFIVVFIACTAMRLPTSVSALAAASLCQVGEFAFVLTHAAAGTDLLDPALAARLLPASILSMIITPLAIAVGPKLAAGAGRLRVLDRLLAVPTAEEAERLSTMYMANHVIIAGYGIAGQELAICLRECGVDYVIVDLNPENVRKAIDEGEPAYFGDVTSPEVLHHLGAERAKEIVVVINDPGAAERAVAAIRRAAPQAHLVVRARYVVDVEPLLRVGAGKVVPAELEAAVHITSHVLSRRSVEPSRVDHLIARIRTRRKEVASREERLSAVPSINP